MNTSGSFRKPNKIIPLPQQYASKAKKMVAFQHTADLDSLAPFTPASLTPDPSLKRFDFKKKNKNKRIGVDESENVISSLGIARY